MVTADGQHIKFGPTSWEEADEEGAVPKTTKVSGVCNIEGEWKNCPNPPKFEDLWKAMRGGGGGKMRIKSNLYPFVYFNPSLNKSFSNHFPIQDSELFSPSTFSSMNMIRTSLSFLLRLPAPVQTSTIQYK